MLYSKEMKDFWNKVNVSEATILGLINKNFVNMSKHYHNSLPNFDNSSTIIASSDYSGEHSKSNIMIYSFLLADLSSINIWDKKRQQIRQKYLPDNRRISFKNLSDIHRKRILEPFLNSTNHLNGISFSVAIDKRIKSLFENNSLFDMNNYEFHELRNWKKDTIEKAFTVMHFLSILCSGLLKKHQNIFWFTDQDSIAANDNRVIFMTKLFSWILSNYLTLNLGHLKFGTTKCDNGSLLIEDLAAIPDLIAGAVAEQLNISFTDRSNFSNTAFYIYRNDLQEKSSKITWWYANTNSLLKRYLCIIDIDDETKKHRVSWFHFYDQNENV